jgi:kynureninase
LNSIQYEDQREFATMLDRQDPLANYREQFRFPLQRNGRSPVYLCGNSLGLQPKSAQKFVNDELEHWADYAVEGYFHPDTRWISYPGRAKDGFAELTGAKPTEVVAMNTLTVNLHVLMATFYKPDKTRRKVIIESQAFPSDRYAVASQIRLHGLDPDDCLIEWAPRTDESHLQIEDLQDLLQQNGSSVALMLLPGVQYYSGQVLDMAAICELGRAAGCAVGLDLAHAVGNVELELHKWAPDFAAWCTYKYLNSGPGAIAGAFVHEKHFNSDDLNPLHGWWGHDEATRFEMANTFTPAKGADLWQMSTPPLLAIAPIIASLEIFKAAGLATVFEKRDQLTGYLSWLIEQRFPDRIGMITPADARGSQLSLTVIDRTIDARALFDRLCDLNVTGDWREPDVIRVAPAPLYNSFTDVFDFAERLQEAFDSL